jgi:hypothetical protein
VSLAELDTLYDKILVGPKKKRDVGVVRGGVREHTTIPYGRTYLNHMIMRATSMDCLDQVTYPQWQLNGANR